MADVTPMICLATLFAHGPPTSNKLFALGFVTSDASFTAPTSIFWTTSVTMPPADTSDDVVAPLVT